MGIELPTVTITVLKSDALPIWPLRRLELGIFEMDYSHAILIQKITQAEYEAKFIWEISHSTLFGWRHWLGVRGLNVSWNILNTERTDMATVNN